MNGSLGSLMVACIFCDIIADLKPSVKAYEDDVLLAIEDIYPRTPVLPHHAETPRANPAGHQPEDTVWLSASFVANRLARERGIADNGYRLVVNVNHGGGQVIFHVHFHLMGGRHLRWPSKLSWCATSPDAFGWAGAESTDKATEMGGSNATVYSMRGRRRASWGEILRGA